MVLWSLGHLVPWSFGLLRSFAPLPLVPGLGLLVPLSLGPGAVDPLVPRSFGYLGLLIFGPLDPLLRWSWSLHPFISWSSVQGTRKSNDNQKNTIYKQQSEIVESVFDC